MTIDGHDVRDVTLESLRCQIGIVLQDTVLFSGTIRENIAYGVPDATQEEIEAVARVAQAHDFILEQPQGYDTRIGEGGVGLSGGQMQRIAIARALLLDPRVLILDDSTSSVDAETEYQIQRAMDGLLEGRTSFIIAQRISTRAQRRPDPGAGRIAQSSPRAPTRSCWPPAPSTARSSPRSCATTRRCPTDQESRRRVNGRWAIAASVSARQPVRH